MKILEQTPYKLTILDRALVIWFFGVFFSLLGLFFLWTGSLITLSCNRNSLTQIDCQLSNNKVFGLVAQQRSIHHLQRAQVQTRKFSGKNNHLIYTVVLLTETEEIEFSSVNSHFGHSSQPAKAVASQINSFINDPNQRSFMIQRDSRLAAIVASSIGTGMGLLVLLSAEVTYCNLDRTRGSLLIKHWGLLRIQTIEHPLEQTTAEWETCTSTVKGKTKTSYRIAFVLISGEHIPLTNSYSSQLEQKPIFDALVVFMQNK